MAARRKLEIALAATISLGAVGAAFTPLSGAVLPDLSAREMALAEFTATPPVPLAERSRSVVDSIVASAPGPHVDGGPGLGFRQGESGPAITVSAEQMDFAFTPRFEAGEEAGERRRTMGLQLTAEPETQGGQRWWIVAGAEHETYVVAPDTGFRDLNLTQVGGSAAVGDAHIGVAFEVTEGAYASLGYVQQRRHFQLGTEDWEEQDHFIGAAFRARW